MSTKLIYLDEFTKLIFEAFPTFQVEVSLRKSSSRLAKFESPRLRLDVQLLDKECTYKRHWEILIAELEKLKDLEGYWTSLAGQIKVELLQAMEA